MRLVGVTDQPGPSAWWPAAAKTQYLNSSSCSFIIHQISSWLPCSNMGVKLRGSAPIPLHNPPPSSSSHRAPAAPTSDHSLPLASPLVGKYFPNPLHSLAMRVPRRQRELCSSVVICIVTLALENTCPCRVTQLRKQLQRQTLIRQIFMTL